MGRAPLRRKQGSEGPRETKRHATRKRIEASATPEFDTSVFDPLIHERIRLAIVSALAVNEKLAFNELKKLLNTTDGNLSVHARKLEEAHYVACDKFFEGRMPRTEYKLTSAGRRALEHYLDRMEGLIRTARG